MALLYEPKTPRFYSRRVDDTNEWQLEEKIRYYVFSSINNRDNNSQFIMGTSLSCRTYNKKEPTLQYATLTNAIYVTLAKIGVQNAMQGVYMCS